MIGMAFTVEQKREWRKRPEVKARQREHQRRHQNKLNAANPARCLVCGVLLDTQRKFCTPAHKALHHRQRPGVAEHQRQLQREHYQNDADYRADNKSRSAAWKASHPAEQREEHRRYRLRKKIARYAEVISIDAVLRDFTYLVTHGAELQAALTIVVAEIRQAKRTKPTKATHQQQSAMYANGHAFADA
jgi:hypothetical protein